MKKNIFLLSTMIIAASVMCGCGASIPEMSETETAMVTEYATNLLIKYSQVADRELLNDEELKAGIAEEAKENFTRVSSYVDIFRLQQMEKMLQIVKK